MATLSLDTIIAICTTDKIEYPAKQIQLINANIPLTYTPPAQSRRYPEEMQLVSMFQ